MLEECTKMASGVLLYSGLFRSWSSKGVSIIIKPRLDNRKSGKICSGSGQVGFDCRKSRLMVFSR